MKKLILISTVLFLFSGLLVPSLADNHDESGENETTTIDANALDALVLEWQAESWFSKSCASEENPGTFES